MRINCIPTPRVDGQPVAEDIDEIVTRIAALAPEIHTIFLFGSGARGELGRHSDLDLCAIAEGRLECVKTAYAASLVLGRRRAIDVEVVGQIECQREADDTLSWWIGAERDGLVLFRGGNRIDYADAVLNPVRPEVAIKESKGTKDHRLSELTQGTFDALRWAHSFSGKRKAGPTDLYRATHWTYIAVNEALTASRLAIEDWFEGGQSCVELAAACRERHGWYLPKDAVEIIDRGRNKWQFSGQPSPDLDEVRSRIRIAEELIETLPHTRREMRRNRRSRRPSTR